MKESQEDTKMSAEVLEVDDDSDIECVFESAPPPKPPPMHMPYPTYQHLNPVFHVKRQKFTFNPKPCSFCRREFRDKVTVARHTVSKHG